MDTQSSWSLWTGFRRLPTSFPFSNSRRPGRRLGLCCSTFSGSTAFPKMWCRIGVLSSPPSSGRLIVSISYVCCQPVFGDQFAPPLFFRDKSVILYPGFGTTSKDPCFTISAYCLLSILHRTWVTP
ncbi:hypothetical protein J4Q44_G00242110, partial [Coregonus suidteri]